MKKLRFGIVVFTLTLMAVGAAFAWETLAPLPAKIEEGGMVSDGTYIYFFGGYDDGGNTLDTLYRYDPSGDAWDTMATMSTGVYEMGYAYLDGKIYSMGGYDGTADSKALQIYDIVGNTWSLGEDLPFTNGNYGPGALVVDDKIWCLGGDHDGDPNYTDVKIYDPATDTWSTGDSMDTARWMGHYWEADGYVYAAGGNNAVYDVQALAAKWSPAKGTWSDAAMADYPAVVTGGGFARAYDDVNGNWKLYLIGGDTDADTLDVVYYYDPTADTWTAGTTLSVATEYGTAACLDGYIYFGGGYDGTNYLDTFAREDVGACEPTMTDDDTGDDTATDDTATDDDAADDAADDVTDDTGDDDTAPVTTGDDDDDDDSGCCG